MSLVGSVFDPTPSWVRDLSETVPGVTFPEETVTRRDKDYPLLSFLMSSRTRFLFPTPPVAHVLP